MNLRGLRHFAKIICNEWHVRRHFNIFQAQSNTGASGTGTRARPGC